MQIVSYGCFLQLCLTVVSTAKQSLLELCFSQRTLTEACTICATNPETVVRDQIQYIEKCIFECLYLYSCYMYVVLFLLLCLPTP